jgi:hypothetical protein
LEINGNNLEPEFEALLKRHVQGLRSDAACHQFDPDTASSYLEQVLSQRALTAYEEHLASCASCRRDLVALSRLLPPPLTSVEPVMIRKSWSEQARDWFLGWRLGALAGFGAVAATALLVATIATRPNPESASPMIAGQQNKAQATPEPMPESVATDKANRQSSPAPSASLAANARLEDQPIAKATPPATKPAQPQAAGEASSAATAPPPPPPAVLSAPSKEEAERKENTVDQIAVARQNQLPNLRGQVPSGPEFNQLQVDRAMERAKKDNEKDNAPTSAGAMPAPKPALKSAEKPAERAAERQRAASADVAEPTKSKQTEMRAISTAKPSAARSRVVSGKSFRQENGIWIDEAYDASKNQSIIRLTNESEVYKQTLKDTPALKPYFDLKPVIIVWQGKVYRVEK